MDSPSYIPLMGPSGGRGADVPRVPPKATRGERRAVSVRNADTSR